MSDYVKRYCKEIKKQLPIYGDKEKELLNELTQQGEEILNENPHLDYNEFVNEIGIPQEVISNYYTYEKGNDIVKNIARKNMMKKLTLFIVVVVSVIGLYALYSINKEINETKNERIYTVETTITEE